MAAHLDDSLLPAQRQAVQARGNVLVMAGAGTGKTKTLVERCLDCLADGHTKIDELLIVTFTEAAAAEMRQRLRLALTAKTQTDASSFWHEQLARFDLAHIGTLHSFCRRLIREHFHELELDPQLTLLDEGEARQRAHDTLAAQFTAHYASQTEFSRAVQTLIQIQGNGRDDAFRELILRLHQYSQTRPDAANWLAEQIKNFTNPEPTNWLSWLLTAISEWRTEWLTQLSEITENVKALELTGILSRLPKVFSRPEAAEILAQVLVSNEKENYPKGKMTVLRQPLIALFSEAEFLITLTQIQNNRDPLVEDWQWIRQPMSTLLHLAQEFSTQFADAKLNAGALDFHDLEQFSLRLLWNSETKQPTAVAKNWQTKLKFIFVDEYQDINAAQNQIIAALSCENRFLVGDIKQSIYRFRLADPKIFRDYAEAWKTNGKIIALTENFRSREGLLKFVNSVCRLVMRPEIGGVAYDADAELQFGLPAKRRQFSLAQNLVPNVELFLRRKPDRAEKAADESELADLDETQKEARLVAQQLQRLVHDQHLVWDENRKDFRAVQWSDMAILLRSPRGKSEVFAKEFERAKIPLAVARGSFYDRAEILDLINLLQLLDNPLQDVPCLAVLRSPLVGLTLDELAEIRLTHKAGFFWTALQNWKLSAPPIENSLAKKVSQFLNAFSRWREMARQISLSQCLEIILAETHYADWLSTQSLGEQRTANVAGLLQLAQKFDQFQRQGLFHFLKFIASQQEMSVEPEVAAVATENAVRLMSIHQSKGLEFPVVVLADLAKSFNEQDLAAEIIFDEDFGLCPKIKPPTSGNRYPSLPHWRAQRRQRRESRGEELRLLYVALTRARDHLLLTASVTEKNWQERWTQPPALVTQKIAAARSFADWLAIWFSKQSFSFENKGQNLEPTWFRWQLLEDETLLTPTEIENSKPPIETIVLDDFATKKLRHILNWSYPQIAATKAKAKSSVTALRREAEALAEEANVIFPNRQRLSPTRRFSQKSSVKSITTKLTAAEIGLAHHTFLQHVALDKTMDLTVEAARLVQENYLSSAEKAALDLDGLKQFWNSTLGKNICAHAKNVRRELPFTARFSTEEIAVILGEKSPSKSAGEFVVVQGVADLVVLLPQEIWLVDFKTDAIISNDLADKITLYQPQLNFYAAALEKIFARRVTQKALHFLSISHTEIIRD